LVQFGIVYDYTYQNKKVVGVFVRFGLPLQRDAVTFVQVNKKKTSRCDRSVVVVNIIDGIVAYAAAALFSSAAVSPVLVRVICVDRVVLYRDACQSSTLFYVMVLLMLFLVDTLLIGESYSRPRRVGLPTTSSPDGIGYYLRSVYCDTGLSGTDGHRGYRTGTFVRHPGQAVLQFCCENFFWTLPSGTASYLLETS
jgi:hypothetical protein